MSKDKKVMVFLFGGLLIASTCDLISNYYLPNVFLPIVKYVLLLIVESVLTIMLFKSSKAKVVKRLLLASFALIALAGILNAVCIVANNGYMPYSDYHGDVTTLRKSAMPASSITRLAFLGDNYGGFSIGDSLALMGGNLFIISIVLKFREDGYFRAWQFWSRQA